LQRRISVVLRHPQPAGLGGCRARESAGVPGADRARRPARAGRTSAATLPGARITGPVDADAFAELARRADADSVAFADPALELQWTWRVLGFGDAR